MRRAIEEGAKLLRSAPAHEATLRLMADRSILLLGQMLVDSADAMDPSRREKLRPVFEVQKIVWSKPN